MVNTTSFVRFRLALLGGLLALAGSLPAEVATAVVGNGRVDAESTETGVTLTATASETDTFFVGWVLTTTTATTGSIENPLTADASTLVSATAYFLPSALRDALAEQTIARETLRTEDEVEAYIAERIAEEGLATEETHLATILADKTTYDAYERTDLQDVAFAVPRMTVVNGQPTVGLAIQTKGEEDTTWKELTVQSGSVSGEAIEVNLDAAEAPFYRFVTPSETETAE